MIRRNIDLSESGNEVYVGLDNGILADESIYSPLNRVGGSVNYVNINENIMTVNSDKNMDTDGGVSEKYEYHCDVDKMSEIESIGSEKKIKEFKVYDESPGAIMFRYVAAIATVPVIGYMGYKTLEKLVNFKESNLGNWAMENLSKTNYNLLDDARYVIFPIALASFVYIAFKAPGWVSNGIKKVDEGLYHFENWFKKG